MLTPILPRPGYLTGSLLVAMPNMSDSRFHRAVIYLCAHSDEGAMGFVINKVISSIKFNELLHQLGIETTAQSSPPHPVLFGGPLDAGRGFVLHSKDYLKDSTIVMSNGISLTATTDILHAIAKGQGPKQCLLALGYAGWSPGQLEIEFRKNGWLHVQPDEDLIFNCPLEKKWEHAMDKIGIKHGMLAYQAGNA